MIARMFTCAIVLALATGPARAADFTVVNSGMSAYVINSVSNPELNLQRGHTYTFAINAPGHPFWIKSVQGAGTANAYNTGVTNNGIQSGTLTFVVPADAPDTLFYNCQFHAVMTNQIHITGISPVVPRSWGGVKALFED
jgi:hypothetical protein